LDLALVLASLLAVKPGPWARLLRYSPVCRTAAKDLLQQLAAVPGAALAWVLLQLVPPQPVPARQ